MSHSIRTVCFDWGGTLMSEVGPQDRAMCFWPTVHVLDGVEECLRALHPRYTLCIATNASISGHNEIRMALDRGGISGYFKHIFCHMDLGLKKNQPEFWSAVSAVLGHPLEQVAMVGDSLEHDAIAPRRFGVQAFWLNPSGRAQATVGYVHQVGSLRQFPLVLANAA